MANQVKKIMISLDESEYSMYALNWFLSNLNLFGSDISVLIFHAEPHCLFTDHADIDATLTEPVVIEQRKVTERCLEHARVLCVEKNMTTVEVMWERGNPKQVICDACEKFKVDLLVMGSHGYGMIKRAFLGSVSNYCVHNANCPVLIVKKPS